MGIFDKLLGRDPVADLEKAAAALERGDAVKALELARRAAGRSDGATAERARLLAERARATLVASQLAKADAAEAEGAWEDAADWLAAAIERVEDRERAGELETRRERLLARADEEASPLSSSDPEAFAASGQEIPADDRYAILVEMLDERLVPRYEGRPAAFRDALLDLNEGRVEAALEALDALVAADSEDPVLRLERGRALLLVDRAAEARDDFDLAWAELGSGPLDLGGSLSLPALWAEAALADGDAAAVAERLRPQADPESDGADLATLYATALAATGERGAARDYLRNALRFNPGVPELPRQLAELMAADGEVGPAIELLEAAVAPSCAGGGCGTKPKHLPSLRTLAGLHLQPAGDLERTGELMAIVAQAQGGRLAAADFRILERYYERAGDAEAAARARELADQLAAAGHHETAAAPPKVMGGRAAL